jgi:myosin heavy subunit
MKQLLELENWIDNTISEANTVAPQTIKDRPLPRSQDIQYKANVKFPDRTPEQALQLYVADKIKSSEEMDLAQNKLINAQKKENEKLVRNLKDLSSELNDHERQAQHTDREVSRLKDLSAKLKSAGDVTQQTAQADASNIQNMIKDLEKVQMKPGLDDKKYNELQNKIEQIKSSSNLENSDVENVQKSLALLTAKQEVSREMFNKVMLQLEKTQKDLDEKEVRFQKSTSRNKLQRAEWGTKFADLNKKIQDIENKANATLGDLESSTQQAKEISDKLDSKTKELSLYLPGIKRIVKPEDDETTTSNVYPMRKQVPPKFNIPDFAMNEPGTQQVGEDLRRTPNNAAFVDWVEKYTPYIMSVLHKKYPDTKTEFPDEQSIEAIHEYMPALWAMDEITQATMDDLIDVVHNNLVKQGPIPSQQNLFPKLDEAYENILDRIIGLPEIFKKR